MGRAMLALTIGMVAGLFGDWNSVSGLTCANFAITDHDGATTCSNYPFHVEGNYFIHNSGGTTGTACAEVHATSNINVDTIDYYSGPCLLIPGGEDSDPITIVAYKTYCHQAATWFVGVQYPEGTWCAGSDKEEDFNTCPACREY